FIPLAAGVATGLFAGLLGAGGGTILMPMLIYLGGVPTTVAIGTDLFQIVITGLMGTLIKSYSNEVDLLMVVIMLVSASAGAQLGTAANRMVDPARIRILFGLTVLSGSIAVALQQASEIFSDADYLSITANWLLLGFGGLICLVIAGMALNAQMGQRGSQEAEQVTSQEDNTDS
ncbi:MAG TPA: sulfite exporter TauE/SafE family protein, partial [Dehalococcoidia bacterium]|nr:sulfite exporter TauE/SafE family protein [Dehalococcoidia bacterium]